MQGRSDDLQLLWISWQIMDHNGENDTVTAPIYGNFKGENDDESSKLVGRQTHIWSESLMAKVKCHPQCIS